MPDRSDMNRRKFILSTAAAVAAISLPVLDDTACAADAPAADAPAKPASTSVEVGTLKSFDKDGVTDTFAGKGKGEFFLIREGGKLYASSSICTHKNCVLQKRTDDLYCKCHRSSFGVQGTAQSGPAKASLARYAISSDAAGKVRVDKSKSFTEKQWDEAGSFIKIEG